VVHAKRRGSCSLQGIHGTIMCRSRGSVHVCPRVQLQWKHLAWQCSCGDDLMQPGITALAHCSSARWAFMQQTRPSFLCRANDPTCTPEKGAAQAYQCAQLRAAKERQPRQQYPAWRRCVPEREGRCRRGGGWCSVHTAAALLEFARRVPSMLAAKPHGKPMKATAEPHSSS
jgi:hypothetical protein